MAASQDILEKRIQANISLCKKSNGVKINLERAAQNIVDLQRGLTGKRDLVGNAYMQKAASLQAYLLYYWPVTYAQTSAALKSCQDFFEAVQKIKERPIRILDLGSGPAPASCAIADVAQGRGEQSLKFEFTLCDSSGDALSLGKRILENAYPKSGKAETVVCNFEKNFSVDKKFDFIIASHSLNELWKNEKKRGQKLLDFVQKVCERLEDDGLLILMEPALLATSRALIELRDSIIGSGMNLVSPCLQSLAPCPALENPKATCHFQFDWKMPKVVADLARLAGLNRADVKMTYFIFSKSAGGNSGLAGDSDVAALVVSEPMLNKAGRIRFVLCDGKSRFTLSAKNGDPIAARQKFFDLRRYDKIQITNAQVRSQKGEPLSLGIGEGTRLLRLENN